MQQDKFIPQLLFIFVMRRVFQNGIRDRTHLLAGRRIIVANAFGAAVAVNFINAITHGYRLIRALRLAHIAIDTALSY